MHSKLETKHSAFEGSTGHPSKVAKWTIMVQHKFEKEFVGRSLAFKSGVFRWWATDFSFEFIKLLQNDFSKQRYITWNASIPGLDRIHQNSQVCRTFLPCIFRTQIYISTIAPSRTVMGCNLWLCVFLHVQIWEPLCAWDISMLFP